MNLTQYIIGVIASLFVMLTVIEMLRRRKLRERHATWWVLASIVAFLIALFPTVLSNLSKLFGFALPVNFIFFGCLLLLFFVALQNASELTKIEDQNRALVEEIALLEFRVQNLEQLNQKIEE